MLKDRVITTKNSGDYWKQVEYYRAKGQLHDNYYCAFNREYIVIVDYTKSSK